ncbi:hypothetical protein BGZ60DRAFT_532765 [Tricladium varicosporioides]|nr:hypothetical protein BGZ60DRAFT_532765 [Hymenoscyphus varicosporioides]
MEYLPFEILFKIMKQFSHALPTHEEQYDFENYQELGISNRQTYLNFLPPYQFVDYYIHRAYDGQPDLPTLRNLRLTSKLLSSIATKILFSCTTFTFHIIFTFNNKGPLEKLNPPCQEKILLNSSSILKELQNVTIKFDDDLEPYDWEAEEWLAMDLDLKDKVMRASFFSNLPSFLASCAELKSLTIDFPQVWEAKESRSDGYAFRFTLQHLDSLSLSLTKSAPFLHNLTNLSLSLPSTHDFLAFSLSASDSLLAGIKSLRLAIRDATGPGGSRRYLRDADEDDDNDEDTPFSNLQEKYPNRKYQDAVFSVISRCHNLELLGLSCTHYLDANLISWNPKFAGLRGLYLHRVEISASNLISLISSSNPTISILKSIWLEDIQLTSGVWHHVFSFMQTLPDLRFLNPELLGYTRTGTSSHLRKMVEGIYDTRCLESRDPKDMKVLAELVDGLMGRAGGRRYYPDVGCSCNCEVE